jgi:Protein of unknown function (DUF1566)
MKLRTLLQIMLAVAVVAWVAAARANAPDNRYQPTGTAGELQDTVTGLIWVVPDDTMEYSIAAMQSVCQAPWRLPTAYELFTLIDLQQPHGPLIDTAFIRTSSGWYWAVENQAGASYQWAVGYHAPWADMRTDLKEANVRCVRTP